MRGIKILQTLEIGCKNELLRNILKKNSISDQLGSKKRKSDIAIYDVK
jgi:hypothetical protein